MKQMATEVKTKQEPDLLDGEIIGDDDGDFTTKELIQLKKLQGM